MLTEALVKLQALDRNQPTSDPSKQPSVAESPNTPHQDAYRKIMAKPRVYAWMQLVPVLALVAIVWFWYTDHRLLSGGNGDDALVGAALLLIPVTYLLLPAFLLYDCYALWMTIRRREFGQTLAVALGMVCIVAAYVVVANPPKP